MTLYGYLAMQHARKWETLWLQRGRLLGLYDELSAFLSQLNLYRGKGLTLSHELALFLQLYNGHSWIRATGTHKHTCTYTNMNLTDHDAFLMTIALRSTPNCNSLSTIV